MNEENTSPEERTFSASEVREFLTDNKKQCMDALAELASPSGPIIGLVATTIFDTLIETWDSDRLFDKMLDELLKFSEE